MACFVTTGERGKKKVFWACFILVFENHFMFSKRKRNKTCFVNVIIANLRRGVCNYIIFKYSSSLSF